MLTFVKGYREKNVCGGARKTQLEEKKVGGQEGELLSRIIIQHIRVYPTCYLIIIIFNRIEHYFVISSFFFLSIFAVFDKILFIFKTILISFFVLGLAIYILSFYDETRYKAIKAQVAPVWHSALTRLFSPETVVKVDAILLQTGNTLNNGILNGYKYTVTQSQRFYKYVSTDETIQRYVNTVKVSVLELWSKISNSTGSATATASGGQQQKSSS